jgi:hypothetical protein
MQSMNYDNDYYLESDDLPARVNDKIICCNQNEFYCNRKKCMHSINEILQF